MSEPGPPDEEPVDEEQLDDEPGEPDPLDEELVDAGPAEEPGADARRTRRIALAVGLVVLAFVAAVAAVLVVRSGDESDYTDETRTAFLAACTGDGGDEVADVCACLYDGIRRDIPYDRFVEVDEQLTAQREDAPDALIEELPDEFDAIRVTCVEEVGPVETATTTTTEAPFRPTTTVPPPPADDGAPATTTG